jgi:hypothetical protein
MVVASVILFVAMTSAMRHAGLRAVCPRALLENRFVQLFRKTIIDNLAGFLSD